MKNFKLLFIIIACANIFAACKKDKTEPTEISKLPAATQTGANTFGCLVNGKAWIAENGCRYFCDPPFKLIYQNIQGGRISLSATFQPSNFELESIGIYFDSSNYKSNFSFVDKIHSGASYSNNNIVSPDCRFITSTDSLTTIVCMVNISKYDLPNGIFSGTFEFTLTKPGCETTSVTEGRFDKKL